MMPGDPVRVLAIHLPQFHPIPENDRWWGKGFTEWTNVTKARPLFRGHYQPHLPADLGFCDLRLPETRAAQADLARAHGIHGFCYYHYWFNGQRLLERPFNEILESGKPTFPFCLCWANEHWTKAWDGDTQSIVMPQKYSLEDDRKHVRWLLKTFHDPRYIRVNDRPIFLVYRIQEFPEPQRTAAVWREEARKSGLDDLYLVKVECYDDPRKDPAEYGFDAALEFQPDGVALYQGAPSLRRSKGWQLLQKWGLSNPVYAYNYIYTYEDLMKRMLALPEPAYRRLPCVTPHWDNSPRHKGDAFIFTDSTPALYKQWLSAAIRRAQAAPTGERLVFINAWNEWAEGNHLEPDQRFGRGYLEATRQAVEEAA